jgi:hypothetical protein
MRDITVVEEPSGAWAVGYKPWVVYRHWSEKQANVFAVRLRLKLAMLPPFPDHDIGFVLDRVRDLVVKYAKEIV